MGISPKLFLEHLLNNDINFFTGVPDSLLKYLCLCIDKNKKTKDNHIIAPNEGSAIALAAGSYLGTRKSLLCICKIQDWGMQLTLYFH